MFHGIMEYRLMNTLTLQSYSLVSSWINDHFIHLLTRLSKDDTDNWVFDIAFLNRKAFVECDTDGADCGYPQVSSMSCANEWIITLDDRGYTWAKTHGRYC